jgi:hypothetical protein
MQLQLGDLVRVRAFGGKELVRRLFDIRGSVALICCDEEYQKAIKEKRDPICIGFPLSDVIDQKTKPD